MRARTSRTSKNGSIPAMPRKADKEGITERPPHHKVKTKGKEETTRIVNGYKRPVLTKIKTKKGQDNEASVRTKAETNIGDSKAVTNLATLTRTSTGPATRPRLRPTTATPRP